MTHYVRYNGPIGVAGENKTTHTAEVKFPTGAGLAVVKAFPLSEKGWVNEALAWTLGAELDVGVPPRAMLLAASSDELASATEPELVLARNHWGSRGPIMLWCTSRLDLKAPQHVWSMNWERAAMSKPYGRRLAAFDAWIGNCDRIAPNAPFWVSRGHIAAIDHERLAFNQDWLLGVPIHMDRHGGHETHLLKELRAAVSKKRIKAADAKALVSELVVMSEGHSDALATVRTASEDLITANFGAAPAANLLTFLTDRARQDFINERLEQLR